MSRVTLPTRCLVALLKDTVCFAAKAKDLVPHLTAVLLHTASGEFAIPDDDEGGTDSMLDTVQTPLLVASAMNGKVVVQAHTWVDSGGTFHRPCLVAAVDVNAAIDLFRPLINSLGKDRTHQTEIELAGEMLTFREDPNTVPGGKVLSVHLIDHTEYPRDIVHKLTPKPGEEVKIDGKVIPASYGAGLRAENLSVIAGVAKRRKMDIACYQHHQLKGWVYEIGGGWRCVAMPIHLDEENGEHLAPTIRVFDPELPVRVTPDPLPV
jgi:hypothetical protein